MKVTVEEDKEFCRGDHVRMRGQTCTGEVVKVSNRYATVAFRAMEIRIPLRQLEKTRVSKDEERAIPPIQSATRVLNLDAHAFSSFNPEIDLHGMSVHRALDRLDQWIDQAALLGHKQLKVIHGKGSGILRSAVRAHLQSHGQVKRVLYQHPFPGGEGITCLEIH